MCLRAPLQSASVGGLQHTRLAPSAKLPSEIDSGTVMQLPPKMIAQMDSRFHRGIVYGEYLYQMHRVLRPSSYLEIGTETGRTLALAQCPSIAVDPLFKLHGNPFANRAETHLFQIESDEFFRRYDLRRYFPDGPDFVFLDGMHLFEFLLRDLMNVEKYAQDRTVVALHDCYPVNIEIAERERNYATRAATANAHLVDRRRVEAAADPARISPELSVTVLDCPPTGLVIVRNLDPQSTILKDAYDEIIAKWSGVTLGSFEISRFRSMFPTADSRTVYEPNSMIAAFARSG